MSINLKTHYFESIEEVKDFLLSASSSNESIDQSDFIQAISQLELTNDQRDEITNLLLDSKEDDIQDEDLMVEDLDDDLVDEDFKFEENYFRKFGIVNVMWLQCKTGSAETRRR